MTLEEAIKKGEDTFTILDGKTALEIGIEATKHRLKGKDLVNPKDIEGYSKTHIEVKRYDLKIGHIVSEEVKNTKDAILHIRNGGIFKNDPVNNSEDLDIYA